MSQVVFQSENGLCKGVIDNDGWNIKVTGQCELNDTTLKYIAAAPPDLRMSRAGSALPWGNSDMAYENTPNKGEVSLVDGHFTFTLFRPNCYYIKNGSKLIAPHVHFTIADQHFDVELGLPCTANRSLTNLAGRPVRATGR